MTNRILKLPFILFLLLISCSKESSDISPSIYSSSTGSSNSGNQNQTGIITAAEWNDLDNWIFWKI